MSAFIQQQVRELTSKAFLTATSVSLPDVKYTPNWSLGMSFPLASYRYVNISNAILILEKGEADFDCRRQRE
ncbi:hypothetical protein DPV78_001902 [Talaromyces pinophilus]|nr:hypothetical protein DPV78_001902 [Talaromyces pinophilus]